MYLIQKHNATCAFLVNTAIVRHLVHPHFGYNVHNERKEKRKRERDETMRMKAVLIWNLDQTVIGNKLVSHKLKLWSRKEGDELQTLP